MNDLEMIRFVAGLQVTADMIHTGLIERAVAEIERRRRLGNLPLMGDEAYNKFVSLCKELAALAPRIKSIAEDGRKFEQFLRAGQSGMN